MSFPDAEALFAADDVLADRYRIVRFVAQGGMGEVYEAFDLELKIKVAVKLLRPEIALDRGALERFYAEPATMRSPARLRPFPADGERR